MSDETVIPMPTPDPVGKCEHCERDVYQHAREGDTGRLGYYTDEDGTMVCTACADAMDAAAAALAAPVLPPSVAEAREAFVLAVARCRDCGEYGVLCGPQHEALADALIAAVRAATVAVACATWSDTVARDHVCTPDDSFAERPAVAIDGTADAIRERVRAALARTNLVPIHHVEGITDIVTRALGVQP